MRLTTKGTWPGRLVLRQGWARAEVRPWNDEILDASVRLVRGGAGFLEAVKDDLLTFHTDAALTPPLPDQRTRVWRQAGFRDHLELDLYRHDMAGRLRDPDRVVQERKDPPWREAAALDRAAFNVVWRIGELGLHEAFDAVPRSAFLTVEDNGHLAGYAVVGATGSFGYLQRIAVHPNRQRRGLGRALVRASLRFVRSHGARTILLNTQPENLPASSLYESEGFVHDRRPLHILRASSQEYP